MSEELTKDEQHYMDTGGEVTGDLAKEAATPPETPPAPNAEAPAAPAAEGQGTVAPPAADDDDDTGEEVAAQPAQPGQPQPQRERRRFSKKEFESERQARLQAEKNYNDQRVQYAKVEERLTLLQQALQEPAQPEQAQQRPDPQQDIFAYTSWLEEQLNTVTSKVNTYEEQIQTGQRNMESERRYFEDMNTYAGEKPDFVQAYNYLLRSRAAELVARSYQVTNEQLQGIVDGKVRVPKEIGDALHQEERELYRTAFDRGASPAAVIYQYATMRGYRTPAAAPAPQAPPAGAPGTSLGGQPPAASGAKPPLPTATDVVQSIQRGQAASASLSKAGGVAPDTELTPEVLANMSDAQFERLYNELKDSDDKEKLMGIFGH